MDIMALLGTATGIALFSGLRLYTTILALGLALRFGSFHLPQSLAGLSVLADWRVLVVAAVCFAAEFLADKIPLVDTVWDGIHTFIRPIGAAVLGYTVLGKTDPWIQVAIVLACGGIGFTAHSAKAGTRVILNQSPEPISNIGASLVEDLFAVCGSLIALTHPLLMLGVVVVFLLVFAFLTRKIMHHLIGRFRRPRGGMAGPP